MKLPKVTIRRAMIAVAIIAVPLGFWSRAMFSRRQSYLSDAAYHARREGEERHNLEVFERNRRARAAATSDPSMAKMEQASRLRVAYHVVLKNKYQKAAAHPWVSIPPDPKDPGEGLLWESLDPGPLTNEFRLSSEDLKDLSLSR